MEVILVPGFLAQSIQEVRVPVCGVGPHQYFRHQSEWLGKQNIVNRYLDLEVRSSGRGQCYQGGGGDRSRQVEDRACDP